MKANKELLQELEMLQFPFVVVFWDEPESKNKSRKLAAFLKCPLINQNDITKTFLRNPSKLEFSQNLAFEMVCEIASTQVSLKLKVVINSSSLSNDAHVHKLMELASSEKAHLIIIQSRASDKVEEDGGGRILKLNIKKDSSFDVKKVVSEISALLSQKEKDEEEGKGKAMKEVIGHEKLPKNDHLHALNLLDHPRKDNISCKKCSKPVLGPSYHCVGCDEYTFHKSCAEIAPNVRILSSQNCPSFLKDLKFDQYDFQSKTFKCNNCKDFSYHCYDCLFQTNLNHGIVPTALVYPEKHKHPLNFVMMPFRYNYMYLCCICNKLGNSISYKCFECYDPNFDAHLNCILPNKIMKNKSGKRQFFLLKSKSSSRMNFCDICEKQIDECQLFYQCVDLPLNIHFRCMVHENQVDHAIIKMKSKAIAGPRELYQKAPPVAVGYALGGRSALKSLLDINVYLSSSNLEPPGHFFTLPLRPRQTAEEVDDIKLEAVRLMKYGKPEDAVLLLRKAYNSYKDDPEPAYNLEMALVEILICQGKYMEASECNCLKEEERPPLDGRFPLYKAIIGTMLDGKEEAKVWWSEYLETVEGEFDPGISF